MRMRTVVPLYFFPIVLRCQRIPDEEGTELPSLDAARLEALQDARGLMSSAILDGRDISGGGRIEVLDENGQLLLTIPFAEAITPD
jgi:hypothetical protein